VSIHPITRVPCAATLAALLVTLLGACSQAPKPETAPAAPAETAPAEAMPPSDAASPDPAVSAPASPPPTTESTATPTPAAANEPSVESMHVAIPSAKMSVAAELRYQFDGEILPNQPVTLHLAALPRVDGTNLNVSVKAVDGLLIAATPLNVEKANAAGVYRQQLSLTRLANSPKELRVLITMDMAEGQAFGFFSVPLEGGATPQNKQDSVKQR